MVKRQKELGNEKFIEEIISLIRMEKTPEQIAKIMGCSASHIHTIRRKCIKEGTWISKEEEQELMKKRKNRNNSSRRDKETIRKEKEEKRYKREQQEKAKKEEILLKKLEQEKIIEIELENIRNLKYIEGRDYKRNIVPLPFKILRNAAKQEDKEEYDGEEDVSIKGRKAFIIGVLKLHSLGWNKFIEKDIKMITNSFYMHPELADKKIIKFLILNSSKNGGLNSELQMLQELKESLEGTKFYKPLSDYSNWVLKKSYIPKIKAMKEQGLKNSQIGEKLRLTSAEVAVLLDSDEQTAYKGLYEL